MDQKKIFVSYSHDSEAHREAVLSLAQRLRLDGHDTWIDQYENGTPNEGWSRWMLNRIEWADHVLIVCTASYYNAFRGHAPAGVKRGVDWESLIITNELYEKKSLGGRFVPVFVGDGDESHVPEPLRQRSHYRVSDETRYEALKRFLAGKAGIVPAPLGGVAPGQGLHKPPVLPSSGSVHVSAAGGTMRLDDPVYIPRFSDRKLASEASSSVAATVVIKAPRQFGKRSALIRYLAAARKAGKQTACVDFSIIASESLEGYPLFLRDVAGEIARRFGVVNRPTQGLSQQGFTHFIETEVLAVIDGPVILAFDETDRVLQRPYSQDFFTMVRMWHNERANEHCVWARVGIVLVSSTEPRLYIQSPNISPFNVGVRLELQPLNLEQLVRMNEVCGKPLTIEQCSALFQLTGGLPFLTHEAFYRICDDTEVSFEHFKDKATAFKGPYEPHLLAQRSNVRKAGLLEALLDAYRRGKVEDEAVYFRLEGAGLIAGSPLRLRPTAGLYLDYFLSA